MRGTMRAALFFVVGACASATSGNDRVTVGGDRPDAGVMTMRDAPASVAIDAPTQTTPVVDSGTSGGCTTQMTELLVNGNFDGSGGWQETAIDPAYPIVTGDALDSYPPDTAPNQAWMGGFEQAATDALWQDVQVPASTTALALTGVYYVLTNETTTSSKDTAKVELRTTSGTKLESVLSVNNASTATSWTPLDHTFTTVPAGQTVRLYLTSTNNATNATNFFFDSLSLVATHCD